MKQHSSLLLEVLRDLEKAIANADALRSGSLDLLKRAAQTVVSELYEEQLNIDRRAQQLSRSRKSRKIA